MQKLHNERNLLQEKELQNNSRLWKSFQNQNATENGNRLGTKNLQKTIKNSRTTICTHKTKYETTRIHHNRNKKHKHRIQTIHNRTQPQKNIQRNKQKKQLKIRKIYKKSKTQKFNLKFCITSPKKIKKKKK